MALLTFSVLTPAFAGLCSETRVQVDLALFVSMCAILSALTCKDTVSPQVNSKVSATVNNGLLWHVAPPRDPPLLGSTHFMLAQISLMLMHKWIDETPYLLSFQKKVSGYVNTYTNAGTRLPAVLLLLALVSLQGQVLATDVTLYGLDALLGACTCLLRLSMPARLAHSPSRLAGVVDLILSSPVTPL